MRTTISAVRFASVLLSLSVLAACGGNSAVVSNADSVNAGAPPIVAQDDPLAEKFNRVVFSKFESTPEIDADYPDAVAECESNVLAGLILKKSFDSVEQQNANGKIDGTLLIKVQITQLRVVSTAARVWGGMFAGSSGMAAKIQFVEASTGRMLREKELSTWNNPWGAAWTWGSSDRSIPSDFGKMIAEYISMVQPKG